MPTSPSGRSAVDAIIAGPAELRSLCASQASRLSRRINFRRPIDNAGSRVTPLTRPWIALHTCAFEQRSRVATSETLRISALWAT